MVALYGAELRFGKRQVSPAPLVDPLDDEVVATIDGERREITKREVVVTQLVNESGGTDLRDQVADRHAEGRREEGRHNAAARTRPVRRGGREGDGEPHRPNGKIEKSCCLFPGLRRPLGEARSSARGPRGQATCSSATRILPLVSGLISSEMTTLTAAATVPTSIGMTSPTWKYSAKKVSTSGTNPPKIAPWW